MGRKRPQLKKAKKPEPEPESEDHPLVYKNIYIPDGGSQYWLQVKHINKKTYQFMLILKKSREVELRLVLLPEELHIGEFEVEE